VYRSVQARRLRQEARPRAEELPARQKYPGRTPATVIFLNAAHSYEFRDEASMHGLLDARCRDHQIMVLKKTNCSSRNRPFTGLFC
jgi:hypothetical protein